MIVTKLHYMILYMAQLTNPLPRGFEKWVFSNTPSHMLLLLFSRIAFVPIHGCHFGNKLSLLCQTVTVHVPPTHSLQLRQQRLNNGWIHENIN